MPELAPWATTVVWPGATASDRPAAGASRMLALPSRAAPTQLVPRGIVGALAAGRRTSDDRHPLRRWADVAGVLGVAAVDLARRDRGVSVRTAPGGGLVDHLRSELDPAIAGAVVLSGPPRANQKPVLQLHDRRGRTVAFVKVAWNDLTTDLLAHERRALEHLAAARAERGDLGFEAPAVVGVGTFAGATWLALGPVGVERRQEPTAQSVRDLARAIERTGDRGERPLRGSTFLVALLDACGELPLSSPLVRRFAERDGDRTFPVGGGHGDFVPWNVLTGEPRPAVWDWERYDPAVPVGFDRIHRALQLATQRRRLELADAVERTAAELFRLVPELASDSNALHLDWYLLHLLCRYEHDAQVNPTPKLLGRVSTLAAVLDDRWRATPCR